MFKLLFKPIKWILSIVLFFVVIISIPLILLYKPAKKPDIDDGNIVLEEYIKDEIDHLIDKENENKTFSISLNESLINSEIEGRLKENLDESDNPNYVFEDENVMFQGVWVNISEDTFDIIAGVHANARLLTYKTTILISFKILDESDGKIILKLNKFKIGHLSFKWAIKHAPSLIKKFLGQDVDSFIEESLGDIGTYDSNKMELEINLYNLAENMEENKEMLILLLDLIYENELITLGVVEKLEDYELGVSLDLNKIEDKTENFKLKEVDKFKNQDDFNDFLQNKALSGVMSGKNKIQFNSLEMNKLIDYIFNQGSNIANDYLMKSEAYEDYEITILNPYLEINNKLTLIVPVTFGKDDNLFKTKLKLNVNLTTDGKDLIIDLNNISIGSVDINNDKINTVLELTEVDGLNGTNIVVENFLEPFSQSGIEVNGITVSDGFINFEFEGFSVTDILDDINNEINNPDLNDKANELLDKINNDEEITEDDLDELFDIINNLDEEDIDMIQDIIGNLIP